MNGHSMDVDDGADSDGEVETRFAPLVIDGTIRFEVHGFSKLYKKIGNDHSKIKRPRQEETKCDTSQWKPIDCMKYNISVGVTVDEEENKFLSFYFRGMPMDKLDDWYCFVDAELRLIHPRGGNPIMFSGTTVMQAQGRKDWEKNSFGWPNFADWDELQPYISDNSVTVEVVIRNQLLFSVSTEPSCHQELIPTRRHVDHFIRPLCNSEDLADVHFEIEGGEQVPAHKLVLASKSRVFRKLLYEVHQFDRVINLKKEGFGEVTKPALLSLFNFFYRLELIINDKILADVYYTAKQFKVDVVLETCKMFVTFNNVIPVLAKAIDLKLKKLVAKCWEVIRVDPCAFVKSDPFRTCEPDHLKKLLVSDELSATEGLIFRSCKAWALNRCQAAGKTEPSHADMRDELGDKFNLIRFPLLPHQKLKQVLTDFEGMFSKFERKQLETYMTDPEAVRHFLFSSQKRKPAD